VPRIARPIRFALPRIRVLLYATVAPSLQSSSDVKNISGSALCDCRSQPPILKRRQKYFINRCFKHNNSCTQLCRNV
jgi:hypothetical protein